MDLSQGKKRTGSTSCVLLILSIKWIAEFTLLLPIRDFVWPFFFTLQSITITHEDLCKSYNCCPDQALLLKPVKIAVAVQHTKFIYIPERSGDRFLLISFLE